jgi:hypothetical protein
MTHEELTKLLIDKGFADGWALLGDTLTLWFHKEEPPAPLVRPAEVETAEP